MNNYLGALLLTLVLVPSVACAALVNINTADTALLDTLPGIGPTKAAAIIDYRTTHGPFVRIEDIQEVKGIGPSTFAEMQSMITVSGGESSVKAQPKPAPTSSSKKQTVERPVEGEGTSVATNLTEPTHAEESVAAPGVANGLAASGASVPAGGSVLSSKWTLMFLGLLVLAGGALMVL